MKQHILFASLALLLGLSACQNTRQITFDLHNPSNFARIDELVRIDLPRLGGSGADFKPENYVVYSGPTELPAQLVDADQNGTADYFLVLTTFQALEHKQLLVKNQQGLNRGDFPSRVQAELSVKEGGKFEGKVYKGGTFKNVQSLTVPTEHTDHSNYIRYEGPGWESDKVGYRFYLDWRNATDIFGKKTPDLVLQNVGQDGFDSYHEPSDWGMDILKVGESLGIGSIGMWDGSRVHRVDSTRSVHCEIMSNGPLEARIATRYEKWQVGTRDYDLNSELSIQAGSRLTRYDLTISPQAKNLCTGLVKHADAPLFKSQNTESEWQYMASWGPQSLAGDDLGMAVLYEKSKFIGFKEDDQSDIVLLAPAEGQLHYYFLAAWVQEPNGVKSLEGFKQYLDEEIEKLNQPIRGL